MPQLSVHELLAEMEAMVEDLREELAQNLDFTGLEQVITARLNELGAELVKQVVEPLLIDAGYVERLKGLGGQRGLKFKEYRSVRVRLDDCPLTDFVRHIRRPSTSMSSSINSRSVDIRRTRHSA